MIVTEQNIRDGMTRLRAKKPGLKNRSGLFGNGPQNKRAAIHQNHHDVRIHRMNGREQFLLQTLQPDVRLTPRLARLPAILTDCEHHHVRLGSDFHRLRESTAVGFIKDKFIKIASQTGGERYSLRAGDMTIRTNR